MEHWLEQAEKEAELKSQRQPDPEISNLSALFQIGMNYEAHRLRYENFRSLMLGMCERANKLPSKYRSPWDHIDSRSQDGQPELHAYSFSSCRRFRSVAPCFEYPFLKRKNYKCLRDIRFAVSLEMGKCEIRIRDERLVKVYLAFGKNQYASPAGPGAPAWLTWMSAIANLDREYAYVVIDWLAFKTEVKSLFSFKTRPGGQNAPRAA